MPSSFSHEVQCKKCNHYFEVDVPASVVEDIREERTLEESAAALLALVGESSYLLEVVNRRLTERGYELRRIK